MILSRDNGSFLETAAILEAVGFRVERAIDAGEAQIRARLLPPDVVLADLDALETAHTSGAAGKPALDIGVPLLALTHESRFEAALSWLRRGVADVIVLPAHPADLLRRMRIAMENRTPEIQTSPAVVAIPWPADMILGQSEAMIEVAEQIRLVAPKQTNVLILGETGTGKERAARAIHLLSRREGAMVSVNCGGVPANLLEDEFFGHEKGAFTDAHQRRLGRFEQAQRGTLFLDEIGDLPLELQPKLLRAVQEKEIHRIGGTAPVFVDTRIIAATNVDLLGRVRDDAFREDLFYRIHVFPIRLPPLRERPEDIPIFARHFLKRFCERDGTPFKELEPATLGELQRRLWPGNIRELENAVETAVVRAGKRSHITPRDLPESSPFPPAFDQPGWSENAPGLREIVARVEHGVIEQVLARTAGNKTQAAELLGLKRTTLVEKLKRWDGS